MNKTQLQDCRLFRAGDGGAVAGDEQPGPVPDATAGPRVDQLTQALLIAVVTARWPTGALLVDLDEAVVRAHLATLLAEAALAVTSSTRQLTSGRRSDRPYPAGPHVFMESAC